MKRIQITSLIMALVLTASVLSGCSGTTDPAPSFVDVEDLNSNIQAEIPPIYFEDNSDSFNSANGQSITSGSQSSDKYAEVIIPTATEYNVCTAEYAVFDPEKVKTALFGNDDITPTIRDLSEDNPSAKFPVYDWKNGDKTLCVDNNYSLIDLYGEMSVFIGSFIKSMPELEHRNDDLDFCTREQAVKNIKDILFKMNINVSDIANVYALNQNDMQESVNEQIKEGIFYDPKTSIKDQNAQPLTSYTVEKSQECYYIVFREEYDSVPIYNLNFGYSSIKLTVFHPQIIAIYSSEGIVGLKVSDYRGNISKSAKVEQVISPESASQTVAAKYVDVAGIKQVDFDKMELMYVITPNNINGKTSLDKAKMIPAWVCTVRYTKWAIDRNTKDYGYVAFKETVLIDAQTGAEII